MKISKSSAAWAGLIACAVLAACATVLPQALRDLPELPAEFARDLAVADTAPVLMIDGCARKVRFATDSPLEERGFEPSVPLT